MWELAKHSLKPFGKRLYPKTMKMKNKKGFASRTVALWVLAIVFLAAIALIIFFLKDKGLEILNKIFEALRFR